MKTFVTKNLRETLDFLNKVHNEDDFKKEEFIEFIKITLGNQGYKDVELLGKGAFGLVFKAFNKKRKEHVALKIQYHGSANDNLNDFFREEANITRVSQIKNYNIFFI